MAALFFDLDGTLLSETLQAMPESTVEGLKKAKAGGHRLFVNTGRTPCDLPGEIRQFPFDGYCCGCGTYLSYQGEVLFSHPIPQERCRVIVEQLEAAEGVEAVLEGVEHIYFKKEPYRYDWLERYRTLMWESGHWDGSYISDEGVRFSKFILRVEDEKAAQPFLSCLEPDLELIPCGEAFYECVQKGYSKAAAIAFFQDHLGLLLDEVYVFGDGGNDRAMFEYARHTVAMKKHAQVLDPLTEYVTDTVENDGIYKALMHYGLIAE